MKNQIANLVSKGHYKKAITLHYSQLHNSTTSIPPTNFTFTFPYLLKACTHLKATHQAQIFHTHLIKLGLQTHIHTATSLTHTYIKLNLLTNATKLFDEIPQPSIALFNAAISGFSQTGHFEQALSIFSLACVRNIQPDSVSIASVLSGCDVLQNGVQMHCWAIKIGVESDVYVATALLTMYLCSADLVSAIKLFGFVGNKNVVCYNAYMTGLLKNGVSVMVFDVFKEMIGSIGEKPNFVSLISVVSACGELKNLRYGRHVHGIIVKGKLMFDTKVGTALVDMYSKCGSWKCGYDVFVELGSNRNLITWNAMIAGMMLNDQMENAIELFVQLGCEGLKPDSATWNVMISGFSQLKKEAEAFMFFRKMLASGVKPSVKSVTSLLSACSGLSEVRGGKEIHGYAVRNRIDSDEFTATALIDMYMKCGRSDLACKVFDLFEVKPADPAFWNAMISGYGKNGESEAAFEIFDQMQKVKVQPNTATFNCILLVCSHGGQVNNGWQVFRSMVVDYRLNPTAEQLNVMVDLLGRSGRLEEAQGLLQEIPEPSASSFASLLGACKYYSDSKLGEEMAKRLSELEPENPMPFVILSNIYAEQGKWEDVKRIRDVIEERGLKKHPGLSLIGLT